MKKEEIEDRLMDALLRGKSNENLAEGVEEVESAKVRMTRKENLMKVVLAIAAMVLFATIGLLVSNQSRSGVAEPDLVAVEKESAGQRLAELDAMIAEQQDKVEGKRKVLDTIVRITGRPYFEGSSQSPESTESLEIGYEKISEQLTIIEGTRAEKDAQLVVLATEMNDYREAAREYEAELAKLQQLKINQSSVMGTARGEVQNVARGAGVGSSLAENVEESIPQRERKTELAQAGRGQPSVTSSVNIVGNVNAPGAVVLKGELVVGDAIAQAGGPSTFGTTKRVSIYREGKKYLLDLRNENHYNEKLYPGDTVEVDQVKSWESSESDATLRPKMRSFAVATDATGGFLTKEETAKYRKIQEKREKLRRENKAVSNLGAEKYEPLTDQPWKSPRKEGLSTFSVDVDTASYTNLRRLIKDGSLVAKDAVRIEELVNYFDYNYPQPEKGKAFGVELAMATCPWEPKHNLVRVALQGKEVKADERGDANLVFLVDVSGSMWDSDKLPLLVESLGLLVEELREEDRVTIVVYAGRKGLALEPTKMGQGGREKVAAALGNLAAGGSTNGGAGIELAYRLAKENFVKGGINRVILATDGDFNVGTTSREALVELVKKQAKDGVFLSVCGFGRGNLNDSMLEAITNDGNGVYYYIDSLAEGRRVFLEKLGGTLVTIAKDVKIQVEFNPAKVGQYRLIGYANRVLKKEDFNNDKVDAGDIGSGHQVTAFYEVIPAGVTGTVRPEVDDLKYQREAEVVPDNDSPDWMTVKLRHKEPEGTVSELQEFTLQGEAKPWAEMDGDYQFASGVALWGLGMRGVVAPVDQRVVLRLIRGAIIGGYEGAGTDELLELFRKQAQAQDE